jgi:hypothetical protein
MEIPEQEFGTYQSDGTESGMERHTVKCRGLLYVRVRERKVNSKECGMAPREPLEREINETEMGENASATGGTSFALLSSRCCWLLILFYLFTT